MVHCLGTPEPTEASMCTRINRFNWRAPCVPNEDAHPDPGSLRPLQTKRFKDRRKAEIGEEDPLSLIQGLNEGKQTGWGMFLFSVLLNSI